MVAYGVLLTTSFWPYISVEDKPKVRWIGLCVGMKAKSLIISLLAGKMTRGRVKPAMDFSVLA